MAQSDYPEKWPCLLEDITKALNSFPDEKGVLTGLLALHGLVKKYEFQLEDDREPLYVIFTQCFGILGSIVDQLMSSAQNGNESALKILHLIVKIFYVAN